MELIADIKKTLDFYKLSGNMNYLKDLGKEYNGRRNETHLINLEEEPLVWRRFVADFPEGKVKLQLEVGDALVNSGVPFPKFLKGVKGQDLHVTENNRYCVLQEYLPSEKYSGSLEESITSVVLHTEFVNALRGKSFEHEKYSDARATVDNIKQKLEEVKNAQLNPETGTPKEEAERIQRDDIPALLNLAEELRPYEEKGSVSWIHGDFQKNNIGYKNNKAVAVYDLDQVRKDLLNADLAHTIDMFSITRQEPVFSPNAPPNTFKTSPYAVDYDKIKRILKNIKEKNLLSAEDISSMPETLALWTINGLAMHFKHGIVGPLGRKKLSREFMFTTRLDICLKNQEFRDIFKL